MEIIRPHKVAGAYRMISNEKTLLTRRVGVERERTYFFILTLQTESKSELKKGIN